MCWTNKKLNRQIADNDITVYKIVIPKDNSCTSLFKEFNYDFHKKYTELVNINYVYGLYYINEGFHSYKSLKVARYMSACIIVNGITYEGRIAKCTIPKGAIYYTNADKEVVSNQIIIDSYYE